jgi:thiol-disulfide isomerase/thioredoxin
MRTMRTTTVMRSRVPTTTATLKSRKTWVRTSLVGRHRSSGGGHGFASRATRDDDDGEDSDATGTAKKESCEACATTTTTSGEPPSSFEETKRRGKSIALAGFATGAAAFALSAGFAGPVGTDAVAGANLATLEKNATTLDVALGNGKPTVLEFYADWCEVCKESAPTVYSVERAHESGVNFVMLNIDNARWSEEMDTYGVDGIPHLEFLDAKGESEGFIVGKFPKEVLESNVTALEAGEKTLPYAKKYGAATPATQVDIVSTPAQSADPRAPVSSSDPRFHG